MQNRTKEYIQQYNISQVELAAKLGMTPRGINKLVQSTTLKLETYEKIANALNIPAWKLFLSDEEIRAIKGTSDTECNFNTFRCPKCGATLKVSEVG